MLRNDLKINFWHNKSGLPYGNILTEPTRSFKIGPFSFKYEVWTDLTLFNISTDAKAKHNYAVFPVLSRLSFTGILNPYLMQKIPTIVISFSYIKYIVLF